MPAVAYYRAKAKLFANGRIIDRDEPFRSVETPGACWEKISRAEYVRLGGDAPEAVGVDEEPATDGSRSEGPLREPRPQEPRRDDQEQRSAGDLHGILPPDEAVDPEAAKPAEQTVAVQPTGFTAGPAVVAEPQPVPEAACAKGEVVDPFDRDFDGKPGGSLSNQEKAEREVLIAELQSRGIKFFKGASNDKLREKLAQG